MTIILPAKKAIYVTYIPITTQIKQDQGSSIVKKTFIKPSKISHSSLVIKNSAKIQIDKGASNTILTNKNTITFSSNSQSILFLKDNKLAQQKKEELIRELYEAISGHQYYPDEALKNNQTGIVKVAFTLSPDGNISNLRVVSSSTVTSLDNAAKNIIMEISPFCLAKKYIDKPINIGINVTFK
ncbi:MAG: energy transducer TonB [Gammaproteobacteria bacterium]